MKNNYLTLFILVFFLMNSCEEKNRKIINLNAFSKLYGYVRWFHPSDEAQKIDWEKFAIYGAAKVENAPNENALRDSLLELFSPIAPSLRILLDSEKDSFNILEITPSDTTFCKIIAWQHLGVELNATFYPAYESIRLNRTVHKSKHKMPQVYYQLKRGRLSSNNFRLKFYCQGNENDSIGVFLLSMNKYNLQNLPEKIKPKYFKCAREWQQNKMELNVGFGDLLIFGVVYNGNQSVLFDNVELEYKDKTKWKNIEIKNWDLNSISANSPDGYYCCSDANYVVGAKEIEMDNYCLGITKKEETKLFKEYPKPGEIINKYISKGLRIYLPISLWGSNDETFPKADVQKLKLLKQKIKTNQSILFQRMGSLVITWNIFQHFYPYFKEVEVDWEKEFQSAVHDVYENRTDKDFLNTLRKLTSKLKDGHVYITQNLNKDYCLPITWEWIEGNLIITNVFDKDYNLEVGDIVTKVNNISAKEHFHNVEQYISAATPGYQKYLSQTRTLFGELDSKSILSIKGINGIKKDIILKHTFFPFAIYEKIKNKTRYQLLENNIIYLNLDQIYMPEIDSLMPKILESNGLICDLRGYPADNIKPFLAHLLKGPDTSRWMCIPQIIYPDHEEMMFKNWEGWGLKPNKPNINIPVVFITDGSAISYSESIMGLLKYYKLGTIVGQPTAGTNGNVNSFTLPGNYQISFTGMKVLKLDGSLHHGIGVLPDIYVNKTLRGVREGRDEFVEKAIEVLNKNIQEVNSI